MYTIGCKEQLVGLKLAIEENRWEIRLERRFRSKSRKAIYARLSLASLVDNAETSHYLLSWGRN